MNIIHITLGKQKGYLPYLLAEFSVKMWVIIWEFKYVMLPLNQWGGYDDTDQCFSVVGRKTVFLFYYEQLRDSSIAPLASPRLLSKIMYHLLL